MATQPNNQADEVNKMLDEIAAQNGDPQPAPQDAQTLLEEAAKPPAQPAVPAQPEKPPARARTKPADADAKVGQLANENANLRKQLDQLRTAVEAMQTAPKPHEAPKPEVQPPQDGGWEAWATKQVNEIDDATWLANPKEGVKHVLATGGRALAEQASQIATARAYEIGTTLQLDAEFGTLHPELMASPTKQMAVRNAITKVYADQRFQTLMANRSTRQRALDVVAKLAYQELGVNPDVDLNAQTQDAPQRKGVYAERAGARPQNVGPAINPERNQEAMEAVVDFQRSRQ